MKHRSTAGYVAGLVVTLISVAITIVLLVNRQQIIDQLNVWQYQPTEEIAGFVERTSMNDNGRFLFYASQPMLEGTQTFNSQCARIELSTAILGCYDGVNIYVFNVANAKLDGIREVTAAHEMLHAAYMRLDDDERTRVDRLVEVEYEKLRGDRDFAERMAFYARTEPGQRNNELHSIIGTEVASISPELERYYKKYFNDRSKIIALHAQYASVFAALQARSGELGDQLSALADQIEQNTQRYNNDVNQLNKDISNFNDEARNGAFESQAQFDSARSTLIARVGALEALRSSINTDKSRYNLLREELQEIASESEALNRSIDSSLAPAPSL